MKFEISSLKLMELEKKCTLSDIAQTQKEKTHGMYSLISKY